MLATTRTHETAAASAHKDGAAERHLTAVPAPVHFLDRRQEPFVPVYVELMRPAAPVGRAGPERLGYGLSGSAAVFYSVLIQLSGSPADGRRQTRGEMDGHEKFAKRAPSAGYLAKRYGWTYDEIAAWGKALSAPRLCPHCGRAHPLLRVEHRNGHRNTYVIVRCQDLRDDECFARALVDRVKRVPTGAADPRTRLRRADPQVSLPFDGFAALCGSVSDADHAQTVGESPTVWDSPSAIGRDREAAGRSQDFPQTIGLSPTVSGPAFREVVASRTQTVGQFPMVCEQNQSDAGAAVLRGRLRALEGFCMIEQVELPPEILVEIGQEVSDPGELYSALVSILGAASLAKSPINSAFVLASLRSRTRPVEPVEDDVDGTGESAAGEIDWQTARVLELARIAEPQTTLAMAGRIRDEFSAKCVAHENGDRWAAAQVLERILTDPRCCGTIGKRDIKKPIAVIRKAMSDGWIWTAAAEDHGEGRMARVFERDFTPLQQAEIQRIYALFSAGNPLDIRRLSDLHVGSRPMLGYLAGRFAPNVQIQSR